MVIVKKRSVEGWFSSGKVLQGIVPYSDCGNVSTLVAVVLFWSYVDSQYELQVGVCFNWFGCIASSHFH